MRSLAVRKMISRRSHDRQEFTKVGELLAGKRRRLTAQTMHADRFAFKETSFYC